MDRMGSVNPDSRLRLVILTGGFGAGKTRAAHQLIGMLPKNWRLVQLDNYVPWGWKNPAVDAAAKTLGYLGPNEKHPVLFEGAIESEDNVRVLSSSYGVSWPSPQVRVIQLTRSAGVAAQRRRDDSTLWPDWSAEKKERGILALEGQVPPIVHGAVVIATDTLTEEQVLSKVIEALK
jgi:hypothetical protein